VASSNQIFPQDRRVVARYKIALPLKHRIWKSKMPERAAEAVDISERGVQFLSDFSYTEGEAIELRFEMPEAIANEPASEWLCTGHVLRVKPMEQSRRSLVAVQFDCYEVARQKGVKCAQFDTNTLSLRLVRTAD